ncbi:hypothetical protein KVR01_009418 [Diaporthe batatas]|uniref:uncharacterized protein n=1 Tax=Diaporthe batatas TaxID=748121 RepID=UPI001D0421BF|nr:uncharacterized protein KVR01_009418 [Diaporthe batatas]KAG8161154.1 hypothetical protein KVR01_009418 [Diaporthe batatas]
MAFSKAVIHKAPDGRPGALVELRRLMDALRGPRTKPEVRPCQRLMVLRARGYAMVDCFKLLNSQGCVRDSGLAMWNKSPHRLSGSSPCVEQLKQAAVSSCGRGGVKGGWSHQALNWIEANGTIADFAGTRQMHV